MGSMGAMSPMGDGAGCIFSDKSTTRANGGRSGLLYLCPVPQQIMIHAGELDGDRVVREFAVQALRDLRFVYMRIEGVRRGVFSPSSPKAGPAKAS